MDCITTDFLKYLSSSNANYRIIKYYSIHDAFEEEMPEPEYMHFLENLYQSTMTESTEEAFSAYFDELKQIKINHSNLAARLKISLIRVSFE